MKFSGQISSDIGIILLILPGGSTLQWDAGRGLLCLFLTALVLVCYLVCADCFDQQRRRVVIGRRTYHVTSSPTTPPM